MKFLSITLCLLCGVTLLAQPQDLEEMRETLRFIRLAETKKNLEFSDEKLLKLNEILDEYEAEHIQVRHDYLNLIRQFVSSKELEATEAKTILDAYQANRLKNMQVETQLIADVRTVLNDQEALQFIRFYERFQRKVKRNLRAVQRERDGDGERPMRRRSQRSNHEQ